MTQKDLGTLNSLVAYAAENIPGGLNSDEARIAKIVGLWAIDGVPVSQVCPHCGDVALLSTEGRLPWLERHIDDRFHRGYWGFKNYLRGLRDSIPRGSGHNPRPR